MNTKSQVIKMQKYTTTILEVTGCANNGAAFSILPNNEVCYISVAMSNACDVRVGDRYKATVKPNFPERAHLAKWIAVRIDADDEDTVLVEDEDDEEVIDVEDKTDDEILTEWAEVVTDDRPREVVTGGSDTDRLMEIRDQMFTTLLHMSNGELDDMVLDVLSIEPMGFVDVLWSILSINPIKRKDFDSTQNGCYTKVQSSCVRLCKAGKLVEASYTTHNPVGKAHTSIVYARRMEQVNPTCV